MNAPIKKKSFEDENGVKKNAPKMVNLCEDMNFHEHDEKSFERMKSLQRKHDTKHKNNRYDTDDDE